jgi:hypothetical protein
MHPSPPFPLPPSFPYPCLLSLLSALYTLSLAPHSILSQSPTSSPPSPFIYFSLFHLLFHPLCFLPLLYPCSLFPLLCPLLFSPPFIPEPSSVSRPLLALSSPSSHPFLQAQPSPLSMPSLPTSLPPTSPLSIPPTDSLSSLPLP